MELNKKSWVTWEGRERGYRGETEQMVFLKHDHWAKSSGVSNATSAAGRTDAHVQER